MDESGKPHTRQKMKLLAQKTLRCVECSSQSHKRHLLVCFHCFCTSCYTGLKKAVYKSDRGMLCSICNTFDPVDPKEEKDDLPPAACKLHSKRYILHCVTCTVRLCYSCKMGKHYTHKVELLQDTIDRVTPIIQEEALNDKELLEVRLTENEEEIEATHRKAERLEKYLKEQHRQLEQTLKEHYEKVRCMVDVQANKRKRVLEAQTQLIKYFQHVQMPYHTRDTCPQEGAIKLYWENRLLEQDCQVDKCKTNTNFTLEENGQARNTTSASKIPPNLQQTSGEVTDNDSNISPKLTENSNSDSKTLTNVYTGSPVPENSENVCDMSDRSDTESYESRINKGQSNDNDESTEKDIGSTNGSNSTDILATDNTVPTEQNDCGETAQSNNEYRTTLDPVETPSHLKPKPGSVRDLMTSILQHEDSHAMATLCPGCATKHKKADNGVNYSEVYSALSSPSVTDIGEVISDKEAIFVRYTPGNIDTSNLLNKVDFDESGNLIDSKTGNVIADNILGKVEIVYQPNIREKCFLKKIHERLIQKVRHENIAKGIPLRETCPCYETVALTPTEFSTRTSKLNLVHLATAELQCTGTINYDNKLCHRLSYFNEQIWLANSRDECEITILNCSSGKVEETLFVSNEIKEIRSIHPFNSEYLLAAARNGLFVIDGKAKLVCKLMKGCFSDVCHHGTLIGLLEHCPTHVKVIDVSKEPGWVVADFHVDTSDAEASIVLQRECIFLATSDHRIKKYNLVGELLWQWGGEGTMGPGELLHPLLSAVDSTEALLMVDKDNRRLQLVDSRCRWQLLPLKDVRNPSDVLITETGAIFVLDSEARSIYCYNSTS